MWSIKRQLIPHLQRIQCRYSSSSAGPQIGFIGLGQMGKHMASHLVNGGYNPIVYDKNEAALKTFAEINKGTTAIPSTLFRIARRIPEIADQCNVIFTMLPNGNDVREVYFGNEGIFPNGFAGPNRSKDCLYLVDCSTIGPKITQELSHRVFCLGHHHVDAPVTGGVIGAEKATLSFLCGGQAEDVDKVQSLFAVMGRNVFHCGPSGAGQIVKICNNSVLAVTMMVISESLGLAKAAGLDVPIVSAIYNCGSAKSWVTELYNPVPGITPSSPASNNYEGGFKTELIEKDLQLMLETSNSFSVDVQSVRLAKEMYHKVIELGGGKNDFSVIYRLLHETSPPTHKS